ncbi:MAG: TonB-dependent receptor [Burkholderiaceae bacterium]|nr:TonB-dependent receptor [Burkholderiaceae bacterium]
MTPVRPAAPLGRKGGRKRFSPSQVRMGPARWPPRRPQSWCPQYTSASRPSTDSAPLGARYSGRQYRTLNNADVNGFTYMGVSRYFTTDLRVVWKMDRRWTALFGINNLNNDQYWNFHPYPQRSYHTNLRASF